SFPRNSHLDVGEKELEACSRQARLRVGELEGRRAADPKELPTHSLSLFGSAEHLTSGDDRALGLLQRTHRLRDLHAQTVLESLPLGRILGGLRVESARSALDTGDRRRGPA